MTHTSWSTKRQRSAWELMVETHQLNHVRHNGHVYPSTATLPPSPSPFPSPSPPLSPSTSTLRPSRLRAGTPALLPCTTPAQPDTRSCHPPATAATGTRRRSTATKAVPPSFASPSSHLHPHNSSLYPPHPPRPADTSGIPPSRGTSPPQRPRADPPTAPHGRTALPPLACGRGSGGCRYTGRCECRRCSG